MNEREKIRQNIRKQFLNKRKFSEMDYLRMLLAAFFAKIDRSIEGKSPDVFSLEEYETARAKMAEDMEPGYSEALFNSVADLYKSHSGYMQQFAHGYWRTRAAMLLKKYEDDEAADRELLRGLGNMDTGFRLVQSYNLTLQIFAEAYKIPDIEKIQVDLSMPEFMIIEINSKLPDDVEPVKIKDLDPSFPFVPVFRERLKESQKIRAVQNLGHYTNLLKDGFKL